MHSKLFEKRITVPYQKSFSNEEMEKIMLEFKPISMEQRWGVEFYDNCLYFYRSWTKNCIFIANFEQSKIVSLTICRDEAIYNSENLEEDIMIFESIIERHLHR